DEWSIDNAKENFLANAVRHVQLKMSDSIPGSSPYDIILANINRNVILQELPSMTKHTKAGGVILLSGLLETDEEIINEEAEKNELRLMKKFQRHTWICLKYVSNAGNQ